MTNVGMYGLSFVQLAALRRMPMWYQHGFISYLRGETLDSYTYHSELTTTEKELWQQGFNAAKQQG